MGLAAVSETIGLLSGVVGIVSGVAGTVVGVMSYRRQAAQSHAAAPVLQPAGGTPAAAASGAAPAPAAGAPPARGRGLRISLKAALSGVLGIVAVIYAGLVSLAASVGEDAKAVSDAAMVAFWIAVAALVLGLLARRDIKRHPERRGKLVSGLGIATAVMAALVAAAASETEATPSGSLDSGVSLQPSRTSVGQPLSASPGAGTDLVAQQIQPQLQAQLQARFPQVVVGVESVSCVASAGGGSCTAQARDSAGGSEALSIDYTVVDPATGAFVWQVR